MAGHGPGEYVDAGFQNRKLTQKCGLFVLVNSGRRSVSGMPPRRVKMREACDSGADTRSTSNVTAFSGGEKECIVREASKLGTNEPRAKKSAMQDADTCPGEYVDAGFQNKKLTQTCGLFVLVNNVRRSVSGIDKEKACAGYARR